MSTDIESQIKNRISAFVSELDLLVRKSTLEALQKVLAGSAMPKAPRGRAGRGPGRPKGSGRRSADTGEAASKIVAHVRANDGQGISAIAEATGLDLKTAKKVAGQLLAAGELAKSGQKRGTVYHIGSGKPARAKKAKGSKRGKGRGRKSKAA